MISIIGIISLLLNAKKYISYKNDLYGTNRKVILIENVVELEFYFSDTNLQKIKIVECILPIDTWKSSKYFTLFLFYKYPSAVIDFYNHPTCYRINNI